MALKQKELMSMTVNELTGKAVELKQDLAKERATIASGTRAENPGKVRKIRRDIARIFTAITAKKREELKGKKILSGEKKAKAVDVKKEVAIKKERK